MQNGIPLLAFSQSKRRDSTENVLSENVLKTRYLF